MKKILLLLAAALISLPAAATNDRVISDTVSVERVEFIIEESGPEQISTFTEEFSNLYMSGENYSVNYKSKRNRAEFKRFGGHWAGFGLHYSGLVASLSDMNLPEDYKDLGQLPKSIGVSINFFDVAQPITRNLGLVTGLGLEVNNFRFEKDVALKMNAAGVTEVDHQYINSGIGLRKSKLTTSYLNIPLLLEFQFGHRNKIFLNAGVIGGLRVDGHTKIRFDRRQELKGTIKDRDNISLRNFHFGYHVNLGYDNYALSASYYPQSIFKTGTGQKTSQINIGLTYIF